jgi:uncharacterized damage-inducible protein DinB
MTDSIMDDIAQQYSRVHELALKSVENLDDQQLIWRLNKTTPSIGFHVWHIARWADLMQEGLTDNGIQIWEAEELAVKWGFDDARLGWAETGMGMDDDVSASLPLPTKDILLDYAKKAFKKVGLAVGEINDDKYHHKAQDDRKISKEFSALADMTIGQSILMCLFHERGHLGMIECMLGVMGHHGSVTV